MPFDIENFKNNEAYRNGFMRPNRFEVVMTPPRIMSVTGAGAGAGAGSRSLTFQCQAVNLPGYQLQTHDVRRWTYGPNEKRPFSANFQQLQLQFIMDGDMAVWNYFDSWMNYIIPHDRDETTEGLDGKSDYLGSYYEVEYKQNYAIDLLIRNYDPGGMTIQEVTVREAFPSQLLSMNLAWNEMHSYGQFGVIIDYLDWTITKSLINDSGELKNGKNPFNLTDEQLARNQEDNPF